MGIEVRVRVLLFLFPVEDFYGFRVRPRVPRALPFLLLSLVFLSFLLGFNRFGDLGLGFLFDSVHLIYLILFFLFYLYRIILFPSSSRVRVRVLFSVPFSFPLLFFWILFWISSRIRTEDCSFLVTHRRRRRCGNFPRAVAVVTGSLVTSSTPRSFFSFLLPS